MKQLTSEKEAKLTELKRELLKSCVHSRFYHSKLNVYDPPKRAVPKRVKKLMQEIEELERELGKNDGRRLRAG